MIQLPYFWLNLHDRISVVNHADGSKTAYYSDGIVSRGRDCTITMSGKTLKTDRRILLPVPWMQDAYLVYSDDAGEVAFAVPGGADGDYRLSVVTPQGLHARGTVSVTAETVSLSIGAGEALLLTR